MENEKNLQVLILFFFLKKGSYKIEDTNIQT